MSRFSILKRRIEPENFEEIKEVDSIDDEEDEERVLFATSKEEAKGAEPLLRGNPESLVCTNIEQIMGGRMKIWHGGRKSPGLKDHFGNHVNKNYFSDEMSFSDGKLEFATYASSVHAGLGITKRVAQDKGPFMLKFKDIDFTTFINIDGEFYEVRNIDKIII